MKDQNGFGIVQALIGIAMLGFASMLLLNLGKNMSFIKTQSTRDMDLMNLNRELTILLTDSDKCQDIFKGLKPNIELKSLKFQTLNMANKFAKEDLQFGKLKIISYEIKAGTTKNSNGLYDGNLIYNFQYNQNGKAVKRGKSIPLALNIKPSYSRSGTTLRISDCYSEKDAAVTESKKYADQKFKELEDKMKDYDDNLHKMCHSVGGWRNKHNVCINYSSVFPRATRPHPSKCKLYVKHTDDGRPNQAFELLLNGKSSSIKFVGDVDGNDQISFGAECPKISINSDSVRSHVDGFQSYLDDALSIVAREECQVTFGNSDQNGGNINGVKSEPDLPRKVRNYLNDGIYSLGRLLSGDVNGDDAFYFKMDCHTSRFTTAQREAYGKNNTNTFWFAEHYLQQECGVCLGWSDSNSGAPAYFNCAPINKGYAIVRTRGDVGGDDRLYFSFYCGQQNKPDGFN